MKFQHLSRLSSTPVWFRKECPRINAQLRQDDTPLCIGHSFPIEDEGIMADMGKGIEIENNHLSNYHLETIRDSRILTKLNRKVHGRRG